MKTLVKLKPDWYNITKAKSVTPSNMENLMPIINNLYHYRLSETALVLQNKNYPRIHSKNWINLGIASGGISKDCIDEIIEVQ